MKCQACGKEKDPAAITTRRSSIMNDYILKVCAACKEKKYEPRYLIVLVARSSGADKVREQITKRLYVGDDILAVETTP